MTEILLRLSESLHAKVKAKATELGKSVNSYIIELLAADLHHTTAQPEQKDVVLRELMAFITKNNRPMTYTEGMIRFGLSYQQLYRKYKPYLIPDKKRAEAEAQGRELAKRLSEDEKNEGGDGTALSDFWSDDTR